MSKSSTKSAKSRMANHYNPPITLTKDLILYQPWGPKLHAMSRSTGEPLWTFHNEFTSAGCCTPVVSGRYAYIGTSVPERSGDLESLRGFRLADTPSDSGKYGTMNAIDLETGKEASTQVGALLLTASLSTAVNAVKGLTREEMGECLLSPLREPSEFLAAY